MMIKIHTSKECIALITNGNGLVTQIFDCDHVHVDELKTLKVEVGTVHYEDETGKLVEVSATAPAPAPASATVKVVATESMV